MYFVYLLPDRVNKEQEVIVNIHVKRHLKATTREIRVVLEIN